MNLSIESFIFIFGNSCHYARFIFQNKMYNYVSISVELDGIRNKTSAAVCWLSTAVSC